jgi:hypothetical protein
MSSQLLPVDAQVTIAEICAAIAAAPKALSIPDSVSLKIVAFRHGASLHQFAAKLTVGARPSNQPPIHASNGTILLSFSRPATELADLDSFESFVAGWRNAVEPDAPRFGFNSTVHVQRERGRLNPTHYPHWHAHLYDNSTMGQGSAPRGNVVCSSPEYFEADISTAAAKWLDNKHLRGGGARAGVEFLLLDRRARFSTVLRKRGRVSATCSIDAKGPFRCGAVFRRDGVSDKAESKPVKERRVSFQVAKGLDDVELSLIGGDGFCYDQWRDYVDVEGRTLPGTAAPKSPRRLSPGRLLLSSPEPRRRRKPAKRAEPFVARARLRQIAQTHSAQFDVRRLVQICNELNRTFSRGDYLSTAAMIRALLDHVPPVFGLGTFEQVASNAPSTGRSFRHSMAHLQTSARSIADRHLHQAIRKRESLPERTQVDFRADVDVLLEEVARRLQGAG